MIFYGFVKVACNMAGGVSELCIKGTELMCFVREVVQGGELFMLYFNGFVCK